MTPQALDAVPEADASADVPRRAGRREWIGLAVLALACLLYVMDLTVLHLAVPAVSADLQPSSAQLLWIIDIYGFMVAGLPHHDGHARRPDRASEAPDDRRGRVRAVSVLAAFSTSSEMLIVSRAAARGRRRHARAVDAVADLQHVPRPGQRTRAIAIWISAFSAGSAIGPMLGGLLLEHFWWGSGLPDRAAGHGPAARPRTVVLPEYRDPDAGRLDLLSAAHVAGRRAGRHLRPQADRPGRDRSAARGDRRRRASSPGVVFVRRQRRLADPMIDLALFRIPAFSAALAVNVLAIFVAFGYFLFVAQYLQLVLGLSPLEAGLWSLPSAVGFIVGSIAAPGSLRRIRPATLMAGLSARGRRACGPDPGRRSGRARGDRGRRRSIISLGLAPVFTLTTELIVGSAPPERAGAASGISETGAELGGALGHRDPRQHRHRRLPARSRRCAARPASRSRGGDAARTRSAAPSPWPSGCRPTSARRRSPSPERAFVDGMQVAAA